MERVAHIVPTVPPEFNGLGDYCYQLWKHWPEPKPEWHVLATRIPEGAREHWPEARLIEFQCNAESLLASLRESGAQQVVLHYVPHAYHPKGIPQWLPRALTDWKQADNAQLSVVFHELYATAPLWRITGWLTPTAKAILRKVVSLTNKWSTSTSLYFDQLVNVGGASPTDGLLLPVGPNIEPDNFDQATQIKGRFVVFGSASTRSLALRLHESLLRNVKESGKITSLLFVGSRPSTEQRKETFDYLTQLGLIGLLEEHYDLSIKDASTCLSSGEYALMATDIPRKGKSGVYASCKAHGLKCIFPGETQIEVLTCNEDPLLTWNYITDQAKSHFCGACT